MCCLNQHWFPQGTRMVNAIKQIAYTMDTEILEAERRQKARIGIKPRSFHSHSL